MMMPKATKIHWPRVSLVKYKIEPFLAVESFQAAATPPATPAPAAKPTLNPSYNDTEGTTIVATPPNKKPRSRTRLPDDIDDENREQDYSPEPLEGGYMTQGDKVALGYNQTSEPVYFTKVFFDQFHDSANGEFTSTGTKSSVVITPDLASTKVTSTGKTVTKDKTKITVNEEPEPEAETYQPEVYSPLVGGNPGGTNTH